MLAKFTELSKGNTDGSTAFTFTNTDMAALYQRTRQAIKNGGTISTNDRSIVQGWIDSITTAFPMDDATVRQALLLQKAVTRIDSIKSEIGRLATITSSLGAPKTVSAAEVAQVDLDYQMAVLTVAQSTDAASILDGLDRAYNGKVYLPKANNQFDVVGDTTPSAVGNSQYHIGTDMRVFIEDQPLWRGGVIGSAILQSFRYLDAKLLVDGYDKKDFGDTHSLVLLVDSLNVQNAILNMLPETARADGASLLNDIFREASNLRAVNGDTFFGDGQGRSEGDVLENVVNALADLVLGGESAVDKHLASANKGGTWSNLESESADGQVVNSGRASFYALLKEITRNGLYEAAVQGSIRPQLIATSGGALDEWARKDFGVYAALYSLSPFALKLGDGEVAKGDLTTAWGDLYEHWNSDRKELESPTSSAETPMQYVSENWLKDRTQLLQRKDYFNKANSNYDSSQPPTNGQDGQSAISPFDSEDIVWRDRQSKIKIQRGGITANTSYVVFGSDKAESDLTGGGRDDHLYGGGGNDTIHGLDGSDWIEGNDGNDELFGDKNFDTLIGGIGNDTLDGGDDADLLLGGDGNDMLKGGSGDDALNGGKGNDELYGDADHDFLNGGAGTDKLWGGTGNDYLFDEGGSDTSTLRGEAGNDVLEIRGGTGIASLDGGADNDILIGGEGDNSLDGGTGADLIRGRDGYDIINGGDGADVVEAGGGSDLINGGTGADYLKGGAGNDTYVFDQTDFGTDLVEDGQGNNKLRFSSGQLGTATYDADKHAWLAGDMEVRKYETGGSTTLAISKAADQKNTVFLRNWQQGQFGITLSGSEAERQQPGGSLISLPSRPENKYVDFIRGDGSDGGQGNDILIGSNVNSQLVGGIGNDLLDGRGGDDWLEGGDGTDLILTGDGKDVAYGGAGKDLIRAGYNFDMYRGRENNTDLPDPMIFWAEGQPSSEWLWNRGDENTSAEFYYYVKTSPEAEPVRYAIPYPQFSAFDFDFTAKLAANAIPPSYLWWMEPDASTASVEPSIAATIKLGNHLNIWRGTVLRDNKAAENGLLGKEISLQLWLGSAGSVLKPGTQSDGAQLWGGAGDDVLYGANNNDKLDGGVDNDLLIGYGGDDRLLGGDGKDSLSGGAGRDVLDGGEQADELVGGLGADMLFGGAGDDLLVGDAPFLITTFDYPTGLDRDQMGGDFIDGGAGNDRMIGDYGDDILVGGIGEDMLYGGVGDDRLQGEADADTLWGGKGADNLDGGAGTDVLIGDEDGDLLQGGVGDDQLEGGEGDDILDGGADNDALFGGGGQDNLVGGAGDDRLYGDAGETTDGADILEGGTGNDELFGGGKGDTYVFSKGDGLDVVHDDFSDGGRNIIAFKFSGNEVSKVERVGLDLVFKYGTDDQVRVADFYGTNDSGLGYEGTGAEAINQGEAQARISEIRFEDGTVWGLKKILAMAPAPATGELPPDPYAGLAPLYFVHALLARDVVRSAGKHTLSFSFATSVGAGVRGFYLFTDEQKQSVRQALSRFSEVLNVNFIQLADGAQSDLSFNLDDLSSDGKSGFAGYASAQTGAIHLNSAMFAELRVNEFGQSVTRRSLDVGKDGFEVLLHEIGHALGLKHPFEPPTLPVAENSTANTVMSYTRSGAPATELAVFDVAALQYLYGVSQSLNGGDDVYGFGTRWVRDSGGKDLFDASAETQAVTINLTPGSWIYKGDKAASILADNQAFIGFDTVIEDATGGSGDDTLTGNDQANLLQGSAGSDVLRGGAGADTLVGGEGSDSYVWGLGSGTDMIADAGTSSADVDTLRVAGGLSAADIALARIGDDLAVLVRGKEDLAVITGHFSGNAIERIVFDDGTAWDAAAILNHVTTGTGQGDDFFAGTDGDDVVDGFAGNDALLGLGGADAIHGGTGNDTLRGADGNDSLYGDEGVDDLQGGAGDDLLVDGETMDGGTGSDTYVWGSVSTLSILNDGLGEGEIDTLRFKPGILSSDIFLSSRASDLRIWVKGSDGGLSIVNQLSGGSSGVGVERFVFDDGTVWDRSSIYRLLGTSQQGTPSNDDVKLGPFSDGYKAGAGNDLVDGRDGDDFLQGDAGNDTLQGGAGNDRMYGGQDRDLLLGGEGNDNLNGDEGDDSLYGDAGNDALFGNAGSNVLYGGDGNDILGSLTRNARDTMFGGQGDDAYSLSYGTDIDITSVSIDDSVTSNDTYTARVSGSYRSNWVSQEWTITDSGGSNDALIFNSATPATTAIKSTGNGFSIASYDLKIVINNAVDGSGGKGSGAIETVTLGGTSYSFQQLMAAALLTTAGNDSVLGFGSNDTIDGGSGADSLDGFAGDDVLRGGSGFDVIRGDAGADTIEAGPDGGSLNGGAGDDTFIVRGGDGSVNIFDDVNAIEPGGFDILVIDALPSDVEIFTWPGMSGVAEDLTIRWKDGSASVKFGLIGSGGAPVSVIESIRFRDGSVRDPKVLAVKTVTTDANGNRTQQTSTSAVLTSDIQNLTASGNVPVTLIGNNQDNVITGNAAANVLNGLSFEALLATGSVIDPPADMRSGSDTLIGGAGDDVYYTTSSNGEGNPHINYPNELGEGNDTVIELAGEGHDTVVTTAYHETLADNVEDLISFNEQDYYYTNSARSISHTYTGNALDNVLDGSRVGGAVRLDGGAGADTMIGSSEAATTFVVDHIGDVVDAAPASGYYDKHTVEASISYTLLANINNLMLTGSVATRGTGNALNNVLDGSQNAAANTLVGGLGDDYYRVDASDVIVEKDGEGFDTVVIVSAGTGSMFKLDLAASVERLVLDEAAGEVGMTGSDLDDNFAGNSKSNVMIGGAGNDVMDDGSIRDPLWGIYIVSGHDVLDGGAGDDLIYTHGDYDFITGGTGNDTIALRFDLRGSARVFFNRGDGADWLTETTMGSVDIEYGAGIDASEFVLSRQGNNLELRLGTSGDSMTFGEAFVDPGSEPFRSTLGTVSFANGFELSRAQVRARFVNGNVNIVTEDGDALIAGNAADTLSGAGGDDRISAGAGDDDITGGTGNDSLYGGQGNDVYRFNVGDGFDMLVDGGGVDTLVLGAGLNEADMDVSPWGQWPNDLILSFGNDRIRIKDGKVAGAVMTIEYVRFADGTVRDIAYVRSLEAYRGSDGNDNMMGDVVNERFIGLAGNDTLDGGGGVDTLIGGQGDDTYVIDSVDDVVVEEANQGTDLVRTSASYALSANVENIVLTGTVSISAMGNALNNKLDGNAGANLLDGGAGADTMNGGAGDDTYVVDNASDMVTESSNQGADKILAGVTYTLGSNVEQLQLTGSSDINGTGNTLANVLTGNAGANVLTGGTGNDTMIGGIGNDIYVVDATTDVVTENVSEGTDTVQSSVAWTLGANVENLTLTGTGGINGTGNSLANMLTGNAGANRLDGGASTDTMAGGAGNDIYVVDNAADVVTEAASGGTDSVESIVTWTLGAEVENLTLTGSSSINGTGNSVANTLRGNTGNNTLDGSAGNDTLIGGAGDDSYVVDATTDVGRALN